MTQHLQQFYDPQEISKLSVEISFVTQRKGLVDFMLKR